MEIVEFLHARFDDDERVARAADSGRWLPEDKGITFEYHADDFHQGEAQARLVADTRANQEHIARHDPARVLAEVDAKRRILDEHRDSGGACRACCGEAYLEETWDGEEERTAWKRADNLFPCPTVRLLALPYAEHPDYQPSWGRFLTS